MALHFLGSFITPVISGEIADRTTKKIVTLAALSIIVLGLTLIFFFNNIILFMTGVFLIGSGFSVVEGMLSAILSDNNRAHTGKVINLSQVFFCVGAIAGPLLAVLFTYLFDGWKPIFGFLMIIFFCATFLLSNVEIQNRYKINIKSSTPITFNLMKSKLFIILCVSIFLYVGIEEGLAFWTTTYFEEILDKKVLGSFALSGYWAAMAAGRYISSRFEKKLSYFIFIGLILSLILSLFVLIVRSPIANFICFIGIGLGFSVIWPAIMTMTARKYHKYTGTSLGIMMSFSAAGGISVPLLIGLLADAVTMKLSFVTIPIIIVLILVLQLAIYRSDHNSADTNLH